MATLTNEELKATLVLPDKWNVRQVLAYDSLQDWRKGADMYDRLWTAAKTVIVKLECPDLTLEYDLEGEYDQKAINVLKWVALAVFSVRRALDEIPKNS